MTYFGTLCAGVRDDNIGLKHRAVEESQWEGFSLSLCEEENVNSLFGASYESLLYNPERKVFRVVVITNGHAMFDDFGVNEIPREFYINAREDVFEKMFSIYCEGTEHEYC